MVFQISGLETRRIIRAQACKSFDLIGCENIVKKIERTHLAIERRFSVEPEMGRLNFGIGTDASKIDGIAQLGIFERDLLSQDTANVETYF